MLRSTFRLSSSSSSSAAAAAAGSSVRNSESLDLNQLVSRVARTSSAYLRRDAPTNMYVSCDQANEKRHFTFLLDATGPRQLPQSYASYYLATNPISIDLNAPPPRSAHDGILVGLPWHNDSDAISRYLDRVRVTAQDAACNIHVENPGSSTENLQSVADHHLVKAVVLQDLNPYVHATLMKLRAINPSLKIVCCPFIASFLSNPQTFAMIREALVSNSVAFHSKSDIQFPEVPSDAIAVVDGGSVIRFCAPTDDSPLVVDGSSPDAPPLDVFGGEGVERTLRVASPVEAGCPITPSGPLPRNLQYFPLFLYDTAFRSLLTGRAAGMRLSWLSHVLDNVNSARVLPVPPLLSVSGPGASGAGTPAASSLVKMWNVGKDFEYADWAVKQFPHVRHLLTTTYGEVCDDPDDHMTALDGAAEKMEELTERLAQHVSSASSAPSPSRQQQETKWINSIEKKLWNEILLNAASSDGGGGKGEADHSGEHTPANGQNTNATPAASSSTDAAADSVRNMVEASMHAWILGDVSVSLTRAALALAQSGKLPRKAKAQDAQDPHNSQQRSSSANPRDRVDAQTTARGNDGERKNILQELFTSRGIGSLNEILTKEEIDADVFLAMSADDLRNVFKATFGVVKKMELLQSDMRQVKQKRK